MLDGSQPGCISSEAMFSLSAKDKVEISPSAIIVSAAPE